MSMINLSYDGKDYTLEFNRQSVKTLENQGFVLDEITSKPMTMIPMMFYGAFYKNHKGVKRSVVDEIYEAIGGKSDLMQVLIEMYAETIATLTDDTEDQGNVSWTVVK